MKADQTWDDRYPLMNHPYLHYGVVTASANFAAGVDSAAAVILVNGAFTVTLPLAANFPGKSFFIKQIAAAAATIARSGADLIDGAASQPLADQYDVMHVVSDGVSAWHILSSSDL